MRDLGRLGRRLTVAAVGASLVAVAIVAAIDVVALRVEFARFSLAQQDERVTQVVASLGDVYALRGAWSAADLMGAEHLAAVSGATLAVYDASGSAVLAPGGMPMAMPGMPGMHDIAATLGPERRVPIVVGGRTVGTAALRFPTGDLLPAEREVRDALVRAQIAGAVAAALIALAFAVFVARRITRPVAALAAATEAQRRGQRGARVAVAGDDEIGDLARGFNAMADTLELEDQLRRRLLGDVAHELRTPLTNIQGHLEALRDGVLPAEPATFASLHEEASRLGRLVADLESLARAEAAGFSLERVPCDLADVARDVAAEFDERFRAKGLVLSLAPVSVEVFADPDRLAQIARNLLSNALKYTPAGGHVRLTTARDRDRAILEVSDDGPGIAAADLPRVFDRFWRGADSGRASGSGIGLTVARELARAHGGEMTVRSGVGRGSTFVLVLPAMRSSATAT
ncbi:MAG TPA: HAMP domain-containing sensor histidine kinase [Candidatus Limnocylindria bacterium]|nr:HAMP domain-containing sensor histidine kinase [Candidatus Limnocylindria bacterium]